MKKKSILILIVCGSTAGVLIAVLAMSLYPIGVRYQQAGQTLIDSITTGNLTEARKVLYQPPGASAELFSDSAIAGLGQKLKNALGEKLEVAFTHSSKVFSTNPKEATGTGKTEVFFDVKSDKYFTEMETQFDDTTSRVQYVGFNGKVLPKPNIGFYFLILVLFLTIPILNVLAILRIRSVIAKGRWWRYLLVILINIPTIFYSATGGFAMELLSSQILFGYSFSMAGFASTTVAIGLPIGGLLAFITLRNKPKLGTGSIENQEAEPPKTPNI